jgi:hypothetical protein
VKSGTFFPLLDPSNSDWRVLAINRDFRGILAQPYFFYTVTVIFAVVIDTDVRSAANENVNSGDGKKKLLTVNPSLASCTRQAPDPS